jgi:hypothetical protein
VNQQKVNYIISAAIVVLALILGFFGMTLPVQPVIPDPLPTPTPITLPTPVDLAPITEQLDAVEGQVDDVGERVDTLEAQAIMNDDSVTSFGVYQVPCHMEQGGAQWTAAENCTWEIQDGATLDVHSGATMTVADISLTGLLKPGFTNVTVTNGLIITPSYTVYAMDSAGDVTITLAAVGTEGQLLYLLGDDANTVKIADTNIRTTDGNAINVGQYDTVAFIYQDSEWLELSLSANQ